MATVELTKDNFEQVVNGNDMVLVDFWAPWCGPCKGFAPVFEAASEKHSDIIFGKVNSDDEQELAASFNIRSIPTLMLFREKVILFSQAGAIPGNDPGNGTYTLTLNATAAAILPRWRRTRSVPPRAAPHRWHPRAGQRGAAL